MLRILHRLIASCVTASVLLFAPSPAMSQVPVDQFVNFESAHVHPLEMSPDGSKLLAVNTANNTLEVFNINPDGSLQPAASIPVGHDPVSVRTRTSNEAWVINLISDTVSVVDLTVGAVVRTLKTCDEPSDVVFAGFQQRAFVSCAERESVQVFDPMSLDVEPQEVLLVGEQPRALSVSPDGNTVYIAFFESGNQTTVVAGNSAHANGELRNDFGSFTITPNEVTDGAGPYGGAVPVPNNGGTFTPALNPALPAPLENSLVVKKSVDGRWLDDNDGDWSSFVSGGAGNRMSGWDLKDRDVAIVDANSLEVSYQTTLGNILMAMSVNPDSGDVYVVGTDATNHIRFEPNLNGTFMRHQVSRFTPFADNTDIVDLNQHLDYSTPSVSNPLKRRSIGDPRAVEWTSDGSRAYVTGMGSNNLVAINRDGDRILNEPIIVGEGPTGVAIHEQSGSVYVLNKFDASISTVDLVTDEILAETFFFDPTPTVVKTGRKHLYDTFSGSGNGTISCASCHVDGKWDRLAWDLGDPSADMVTINGRQFHPMKGLKVTQSLIDIIDRGALHWRGDKPAFRDFHLAFENLKGREPVSDAAMQEFEEFLATTYYPPNPYRGLHFSGFAYMNEDRIRGPGTSFISTNFGRSLGLFEINGNPFTDSAWPETCGTCHLNETGRGPATIGDNISADLRLVYRKLGFYTQSTESTVGFGMMSDGIFDTGVMDNILNPADENGLNGYLQDYQPLLLSFGGSQGGSSNGTANNAHSGIGMQETLNGSVGSVDTISEYLQVATSNRWDPVGLVVHGIYQGDKRGFVHIGGDNYQSDAEGELVSHLQLVSSAVADNAEPLTWTIVHDQNAQRLGIDRNANGLLNRDDFDDADNDGVADEIDQFPDNPSESADADGDGIGNNADLDDDNDGVPDTDDDLPFNPSESLDSDADGIGNNADEDDDGDGVLDIDDAFPLDFEESADTDGDGIGDNADVDADNDGIPNEIEAGDALDSEIANVLSESAAEFSAATRGAWVSISRAEYDSLVTSIVDVSRFGTAEGSMQTGPFDNWGNSAGFTFGHTTNPSPANVNLIAFKRSTGFATDGSNDFVRLSPNNNGRSFEVVGNPLSRGTVESNEEYWVLKGSDARTYAQPMYLGITSNETNPIRYQANGTRGLWASGSSETVANGNNWGWAMQGLAVSASRNFNPASADADNDGVPNERDLDSDNDGIPDVVEAGGNDANNDGVIDGPLSNQGSLSEPTDSDGDGLPDFLDPDGRVFSLPLNDSDGDGWDDSVDGSIGGEDFDGDGIPNSTDPDDDNDGVLDVNDAFPRDLNESIDTDGDGIGNNADTDDDGDGVIDSVDEFPLDPSRSSSEEEDPDPNPENEGVISNQARGITLDGNLNDWTALRGFTADPDDVSGPNDPLDWIQAWMAHDAENFYLAYRNDGPINSSWGQTAYIDTDSNRATGYNNGLAIGADYVIQGQSLYSYTGNGSDFSFDYITDVASGSSETNTEMRFAQSALGSPTVLRLAFVGGNAAYPEGTVEDLYPDGIYTSDASVRYLEYTVQSSDNSAPQAESQSVVVVQNSNLEITLFASDADGDVLTYAIAIDPANGTVQGAGPTVTYTPDADFTGEDAFSFTVNDGVLTSGIATVSISVRAESELQIVSNRATDLTIDGNLSDWAAFRSFGEDRDDISGEENPIDWREGWVAHDEQNFYFAYRNHTGNVSEIEPWTFNIAIDSDRNPATGYRDGGAIGADYLLQGGSLYRHTGVQQSEWDWEFVAGAVREVFGNSVEIGISRQALDDVGDFDLMYFGDNRSIGGNTEDLYPDGIYDSNDAIRFFSYSTNGLPSIEIDPLFEEANDGSRLPSYSGYDNKQNAQELSVGTDSGSSNGNGSLNLGGGSGPVSPSWLLLTLPLLCRRRAS